MKITYFVNALENEPYDMKSLILYIQCCKHKEQPMRTTLKSILGNVFLVQQDYKTSKPHKKNNDEDLSNPLNKSCWRDK